MKFFAGSDRVAVLKICDLYLSGDAKLAAEIGRALLHPNSDKPLRYLVGLAHVSSNPESLLERERALEVLTPIIDDNLDSSPWRLLAAALATAIHRDSKRSLEADRSAVLFDKLFEALPIHERESFAKVRELVNGSTILLQIGSAKLQLEALFNSSFLDPVSESEDASLDLGKTSPLSLAS